MPPEETGGGKFAQLVSYHILGDKDLVKDFAVMDQKRETHEFRNYRASSCPGLDWLTRAGSTLFVDLDKQLLINVWSFFEGSSHLWYLVITELTVFASYFCVFG